ncbi:MAG: dipeptidase [Oscillospiraceae bacterium]|jgi:membrane dipeptidase|nr:dipeptidase [Oscillospiraceae bacterium]
MNFFDLHCDTIYECALKGRELYDNNFHISLKKGKRFKNWIECFAIWAKDDLPSLELESFIFKTIDFWQDQIKKNSEIIFCKNKSDLKSVRCGEKMGGILCIEGLSFVTNDLSVFDSLYEKGVRLATLTWNNFSKIGDGSSVVKSRGLTDFGKLAVAKMLELNMLVDISHASDALFYDVFECFPDAKGILATHSNSRKICNHARNLTDEQFLKLKSKNSIVGLTFCKHFLRTNAEATSWDIMRHAEHFLELGGENVLSLGSDFDGADMPQNIVGIESMYNLYEMFLRHYKEDLVKAIFFENAYNFFCRNLK